MLHRTLLYGSSAVTVRLTDARWQFPGNFAALPIFCPCRPHRMRHTGPQLHFYIWLKEHFSFFSCQGRTCDYRSKNVTFWGLKQSICVKRSFRIAPVILLPRRHRTASCSAVQAVNYKLSWSQSWQGGIDESQSSKPSLLFQGPIYPKPGGIRFHHLLLG